MRLVAIGVAVGFLLGAVVSVSAQLSVGSYFYSVSEIQAKNQDLRLGYAAGVFDTINKLAGDASSRGSEISTSKILTIARCLNGYARTNLGTFAGWAAAVYPKYRTSVSGAAALLSECLP